MCAPRCVDFKERPVDFFVRRGERWCAMGKNGATRVERHLLASAAALLLSTDVERGFIDVARAGRTLGVCGRTSVFQDEGDHQVHLVLGDLPRLHANLLLLDPGAADLAE